MSELKKAKLKLVFDKKVQFEDIQVENPQKMVDFINSLEEYNEMADEYAVVVALDNANKPIAYTEIAKGNERFCNIDITSVFKFVLLANSNKFILVHNHPFHSNKPSKKDLEITQQLKKASEIMQMTFLDHIIITGKKYISIMSILDR